jgi:hypothetical protein
LFFHRRRALEGEIEGSSLGDANMRRRSFLEKTLRACQYFFLNNFINFP